MRMSPDARIRIESATAATHARPGPKNGYVIFASFAEVIIRATVPYVRRLPANHTERVAAHSAVEHAAEKIFAAGFVAV